MTEDEMVGWHHWLNGHEFEQILGDSMKDREARCAAVHGMGKRRAQFNWIATSNPGKQVTSVNTSTTKDNRANFSNPMENVLISFSVI